MMPYITICVLLGVFVCVHSQTKVDTSEDGNSGTITFSTPGLDDDEAHSPWMPDVLKCDACRAVSYKVG